MAAYLQEQQQQQQRRLPLLKRCCACAEPACEMQLFECLHWLCKGCLHVPDVKGVPAKSPDRGNDCRSAVAAWQQASRCPLCSENVALLALVTLGNCFSSASASNASGDRRICDVPACGPCAEAVDACKNAAAAPNVASCRCSKCDVFLCDSCAKRHARFAPTHRDSVTMLQPLSCSSPTSFTVVTHRPTDTALTIVTASGVGAHDCACSLFCLDCRRPACPAAGCLSACVDACHSLAAVDGGRVRAAASNAAQKLLASRNAATGIVNLLLARRGSRSSYVSRPLPPSETPKDGGRAEVIALLEKHRQSALEVLRIVRERAAMRTKAVYDAGHGSGRGSRSFQCELAGAVRIVEQAKRYGIALAICGSSSSSTSGGAHVLQQQRLVLWRVRWLTARIEHLSQLVPSTKMPFAVHKRQRVSKDLDELSRIVTSWIGTPCIADDQGSKNVAAVRRLAVAVDSSKTFPLPLVFGPMHSNFRIQSAWRDLTVSADGSLLIAALQDGMHEYSPHGNLIGTWQPVHDLGSSVVTLRALSDGRVVVGPEYAHAIVVLRRATGDARAGSSTGSTRDTLWQVDRRIAVRAMP